MAGSKEHALKIGANTRFSSENQPENRGRKPGVPTTATRLSRFLSIVQNAKNPVTLKTEQLTIAEQIDLKQLEKALKGDTAAWEKLLDRMEGKTVQRNENMDVSPPGEIVTITPEKIARMKAAIGEQSSDNGNTSPIPGKRKKQQ